MRASLELVTVASLALGLAQAQINQLPTCAQSCVAKYTTGGEIGGCKNLDIKCICSSSSFLSGIACCLAGACDQADQEAATNFALTFCKAAGVTGLPTAVSCTSSVTFTGSSAAPSGSSSTSSGAVSVTTTSGSSSATSSAPSVASTAASSQGSSSSAASMTSSVSAAGGSSTGSSTAPTSSHSGNAGHRNSAEMGAGVLGGLIAAAVML